MQGNCDAATLHSNPLFGSATVSYCMPAAHLPCVQGPGGGTPYPFHCAVPSGRAASHARQHATPHCCNKKTYTDKGRWGVLVWVCGSGGGSGTRKRGGSALIRGQMVRAVTVVWPWNLMVLRHETNNMLTEWECLQTRKHTK
jgi:hypothetical protein